MSRTAARTSCGHGARYGHRDHDSTILIMKATRGTGVIIGNGAVLVADGRPAAGGRGRLEAGSGWTLRGLRW
jgi:hypothetical protein